MTDDRVVLVVEFHAAAGRADALRAELLALVEPTRSEPGCVLYDLHDDPADPDHLVFYEIWDSPRSHAAHDLTEHVAHIRDVLPDLTTEAPRVLRLRRIEE